MTMVCRATGICAGGSREPADEPLDDFGTSELMRGYYEQLLAGSGRSEALRDIQRELINTGAYGHPYYWAGFIASGDWRSLPAR